MDRNTILAVILSVLVITVGMTIQATFFAPSAQEEVAEEAANVEEIYLQPEAYSKLPSNLAWGTDLPGSLIALESPANSSPFVYETDIFLITFDPKGASISSFKLKKHLDKGEPVELLFGGSSANNAFLMYAGSDRTQPIDAPFNYRIAGNQVIFTQTFAIKGEDVPFTLTKTFTFGESEYLFQIDVNLVNSENKAIPLAFDNTAYTIGFEPQIGPSFTSIDNRYSYRRFYIREDGAKKKATITVKNGIYTTEKPLSWVALTGKYFSMIAIPDATNYTVTLSEDTKTDIPLESNVFFSRPAIRSADQTDTYRFYIGPQLKADMVPYNDRASNSFGLSNLFLEDTLDSSSWLGWLETILKTILNLLYKVIPNYGVGIIILTFLLKLILHPITKKGMESTAKMSALGPQMEEIKARYPDNPTKQNEEMAELYKREKINPMGGCLPMLLQFPILIAFYGLLNKHFELRGAMFIPGWIPDLSVPETVATLPFNLPFLGNEIHLLPILYTVSMIYSMKITQSSSGGAASQQGMMKMMTYGMPIMFFFVLYNAPSGLILYWSVMNVISVVQQLYTNKKKQKEGEQEKVIQFQPKAKGKKR
ncbi:MAG TPA: membrane protein insertase YidC [Sphaerochaeta sp.]|nr:membrane protein insertase YidC [Sphaerochaeta sp.]